MITTCPVCGKGFDILWPHLWAYKEGKRYLCTWKCLRQLRKEEEGMERTMYKSRLNLTDEQKEKAVDIALKGGNPLPFLKECGAKNPSTTWTGVRNWASKLDWDTDVMSSLPESFGHKKRTLGDAMDGMKEAADEFFEKCAGMGLNGLQAETPETPTITIDAKKIKLVETPEGEYVESVKLPVPPVQPEITKPVNYDGFLMDVIRSPETGARYEVKDSTLFLKIGVDEFALEIDEWRKLLDEIPKAAAVLGVQL